AAGSSAADEPAADQPLADEPAADGSAAEGSDGDATAESGEGVPSVETPVNDAPNEPSSAVVAGGGTEDVETTGDELDGDAVRGEQGPSDDRPAPRAEPFAVEQAESEESPTGVMPEGLRLAGAFAAWDEDRPAASEQRRP